MSAERDAIVEILKDLPTDKAERIMDDVEAFLSQKREDDYKKERDRKLGWQRRLRDAGITEIIPGIEGYHIPMLRWQTDQRNVIQAVWAISQKATFNQVPGTGGNPGYVEVIKDKDE